MVGHGERSEEEHEEALQGGYGHDGPAEEDWALVLNHAGMHLYNCCNDMEAHWEDVSHEDVFPSSVLCPLESYLGCMG